MDNLFKELGDLEQNLFILKQVLLETQLTADEEAEVRKEMTDIKKNITRISNKIKRLQKGKM